MNKIWAQILMMIVLIKTSSGEEQLPCCTSNCDPVYPVCKNLTDLVIQNFQMYKTQKGYILGGNLVYKEKFEMDPDGSVIKCKIGNERSLECEDSLLNPEKYNNIYNYKGDEIFCQNRTCETGASTFFTCNCRNGNLLQLLSISSDLFTDEEVISVDQVPVATMRRLLSNDLLNSDFEDEPILKRQILSVEDEAMQNQDVFVDLKNNKLRFIFVDTGLHTVVIRKDGYSSLIEINSSPYDYELPKEMLIVSGDIYIEIYHDSQIVFRDTVFYYAASICRYSKCTVCWNAVSNWSCLDAYQRAFIVLLLMSMTAVLILLCKALYSSGVWKCIALPFYGLWVCCCSMYRSPFGRDLGKAKTKVVNFKNYFVPSGKIIEEEVLPVRSPESRRRSSISSDDSSSEYTRSEAEQEELLKKIEDERKAERRQRRKLKKTSKSADNDEENFPSRGGSQKLSSVSVYSVLCLVCLAQSGLACDSGLFSPASYSECIRTAPNIEECKTLFSVSATIQQPGAKNCILVTKKDNATETIATVTVTYVQMRNFVGVSTDYFTSLWKSVTQSNKRCPGTTNCPSKCSQVNTDQVRNAYGELTDNVVVNYPGRVRCRSSCGCVSCGCFECRDGCTFSGIGLQAYADVATVKQIVSSYLRPTLQVEIVDDQYTFRSSLTANSECAIWNGYKVCIIGSLVGDSTLFGANKIIEYKDSSYLAEASAKGFPQANSIGDIQAVSSSNLALQSTSAFLYAPGLWTVSETQNSDIYTTLMPGLSKISSATKFPSVIGGNYWVQNNGNYYSDLTNPGPLMFTLETAGNKTFSRRINVVCPKATLVSVSGCYNCETGCTAVVKVKSECLSGTTILSVDEDYVSLSTNGVLMNTTESEVLIRFTTNKENNNFNLKFKASGNEASINLKFLAISGVELPEDHDGEVDRIEDDKNEPSSGWFSSAKSFGDNLANWFDDIFNGSGAWWDYIIFFIIIIVMVVLSYFLIRFLWILSASLRNRIMIKALENERFKNLYSNFLGDKSKTK